MWMKRPASMSKSSQGWRRNEQPGPEYRACSRRRIHKQFDALDPENDIVVLAGSKPTSLPEDYYQTIIHRLTEKGVPF